MFKRFTNHFGNNSIARIILLWLGWILVIFLFQAFIYTRFQLERPDTTMDWTIEHTPPVGWNPIYNSTNLFLRSHTAWDSNYYISIATNGYGHLGRFVLPSSETLATDYAFLPFYPFLMRFISLPLIALGFNVNKVIILSGLLISLLGTLAGLIAMYSISKKYTGETNAFRTAFYILIFPTSLFLAQVYTEGLFIGLAFSSLAFLDRKKYIPAVILAVLATWTRSIGILLSIPIGIVFIQKCIDAKWNIHDMISSWYLALYSIFPILAYGIWRISWLGHAFALVEKYRYGRGIFQFSKTLEWLKHAIDMSKTPQTASYFGLELILISLGLIACIYTFKKYPGISLFSFFAIIISLTSGVLISQSRYILVTPALFLFLGDLGKSEIFDRLFTLASVLLLGVFLTLFTFRFWAG